MSQPIEPVQQSNESDDGFSDEGSLEDEDEDGDQRVTLDLTSTEPESLDFLKTAVQELTPDLTPGEELTPNDGLTITEDSIPDSINEGKQEPVQELALESAVPVQPVQQIGEQTPIVPKRPTPKSAQSSQSSIPSIPRRPTKSPEVKEQPVIPTRPVKKTLEVSTVKPDDLDRSLESSPVEIPSIPQRPVKHTPVEVVLEPQPAEVSPKTTDIPVIPKRPSRKSSTPEPAIPAIPQRPKRVPTTEEKIDTPVESAAEVEIPVDVEKSTKDLEESIEPEVLTKEEKVDEIVEEEQPEIEDEGHDIEDEGKEPVEFVDIKPEEDKVEETSDELKDIEPGDETILIESTSVEAEPQAENEAKEELDAEVETGTKQPEAEEISEVNLSTVQMPVIPKRPLSRPHKKDTIDVSAAEHFEKPAAISTPITQQLSTFGPNPILTSTPLASVTDEIIDIYGAESPVQLRTEQPLPLEVSSQPAASKKPPPPKPKKLSSKILAFQQQLMSQQQPELDSKPYVPTHRPKPPSRTSTTSSIVSDSSKEESAAPKPRKVVNEFAKNLNGLWGGVALPGMVMPGLVPPAVLTKESDEKSDEPVKDIRRGRAKGPRGRKLPSSATEPVVKDEPRFQIHIAQAWELKSEKITEEQVNDVEDVLEELEDGVFVANSEEPLEKQPESPKDTLDEPAGSEVFESLKVAEDKATDEAPKEFVSETLDSDSAKNMDIEEPVELNAAEKELEPELKEPLEEAPAQELETLASEDHVISKEEPIEETGSPIDPVSPTEAELAAETEDLPTETQVEPSVVAPAESPTESPTDSPAEPSEPSD